jgi:phage-related tail fiber protein
MRSLIGKNMALGKMSDSNALLQARKEFDNWVLEQSPDAFAAGNASKQTAAAKAVRDSITELIISKNPHVNVAESLNMQSKLFGILDTLRKKVPAEANNRIGRAWQKISGLPGFRSKLNSVLSVATGTGVLGATAVFAPAISVGLGGALVVTLAGKALSSAQAKTALSFMLKEVDNTIQSSKVARDIIALQLSKKTIEELISTMDMQDQQNPNAVQSQIPSGQPAVVAPLLAPARTPPLPGPVAQTSPQDMPFNALQGTGIAQALRPQEAYRQAMTGIGGR